MKRKLNLTLIGLLVILLSAANIYGQVKTNLEIMDSLIGKSITDSKVKADIAGSSELAINIPADYSYFEAKILSAFRDKIPAIKYSNRREGQFILYSLELLRLEYRILSVGSFFTSNEYQRKISLKFSIKSSLSEEGESSQELEYTDTIAEDDVKLIGNTVYPFTLAPLPDDEEWGYLLKPAIATAASAILVYLFYTVRNN